MLYEMVARELVLNSTATYRLSSKSDLSFVCDVISQGCIDVLLYGLIALYISQ